MDQRKLQILGAIVEDYVSTREPVGSKALLERHELGVSPATVRNDMSVLEEEGLITQPYTSAGRIPTDKGYRVFVDSIAQIKPLSLAERKAIHALIDGSADLDDVLGKTVRLLSQLTHQVALVQYPSLNQAKVKHIELVGIDARQLLVVLITDTGRIDQRMIETAHAGSEEFIYQLRQRINQAAQGKPVTGLEQTLDDVVLTFEAADQVAAEDTIAAVKALLELRREEKLIMAGAANLARYSADLTGDFGALLDALEEQIVLLRLLGETTVNPGEVDIRIGHEIADANLSTASLISAGYGRAEASGAVAKVAVLGPTRMDYPTSISSVQAVARYISRFFG